MFELVFILAGVIVLITHGPMWLAVILLAIGGIWLFSDGDFDLF